SSRLSLYLSLSCVLSQYNYICTSVCISLPLSLSSASLASKLQRRHDGRKVFEFWRDHAHVVGGEPPALALLVPPRSLLVFTEEAYSAHLHGIADRRYDEITAVANWKGPSSWARWAPSPWAARQLEPAAAEADGDCAGGALPVACGLRREESAGRSPSAAWSLLRTSFRRKTLGLWPERARLRTRTPRRPL
ncbi:unnamed protein product, partial [Prorocentrum cordatum]